MDPDTQGSLETHSFVSGFRPERPFDEWAYRELRCACGSGVFRVAGRPRVVSGPGGFFWRSLTRVWREASQRTGEGEPIESPFALPIETQCEACGLREERFEAACEPDRPDGPVPRAPREAYRCRDCRRGLVELVVGTPAAEASSEGRSVDVVARCRRCGHQARIASSASRLSDQERKLDLLYGRR